MIQGRTGPDRVSTSCANSENTYQVRGDVSLAAVIVCIVGELIKQCFHD